MVEGTVPGRDGFGKLYVWEGSAKENVWSEVDQYVEFRSYALSKLSDFGYFDHLLEDLGVGPFVLSQPVELLHRSSVYCGRRALFVGG